MPDLKAYGQLMRLHKPIGFLLLLWPTLWALWLAARGMPNVRVLTIFVLGVFLMRSAGCVINDIADHRVDGGVARTNQRPLVVGRVSVRAAAGLFVVLCLLAFGLVLLLHPLTILLSFFALALAVGYPFCKRFMVMPQLVLGLAFAFGIPMAFAEIRQAIPLTAWWLLLATALWIVAYDTQYALADREDDLKMGIYSSAIFWGRFAPLWIILFQVLMLAVLIFVGWWMQLGVSFYSALVAAGGFFLYQQRLLRQQRWLDAFANNQWVGMVIFIGILIATIL